MRSNLSGILPTFFEVLLFTSVYVPKLTRAGSSVNPASVPVPNNLSNTAAFVPSVFATRTNLVGASPAVEFQSPALVEILGLTLIITLGELSS